MGVDDLQQFNEFRKAHCTKQLLVVNIEFSVFCVVTTKITTQRHDDAGVTCTVSVAL